jgi:hypothetical protein
MDIEDNSSHQIDQSRTHMTFTPQDFVSKWKRVTAREKQT